MVTGEPASDEVFGAALDFVLTAWSAGIDVDSRALCAAWPSLGDDCKRVLDIAREVAVVPAPFRPTVPGYRLLDEAGRGGMGIVYRAMQLGVGRQVALKVLPGPSDARNRERFLAEARAMGRIRHPHVVTIFEVVELADLCAYSMEWIDGGSLQSWIERRRESDDAVPDAVRWCCRMGIAIARALGEVHRAGLLHRDVKPSNVLLRTDGTPLLADFGLVHDGSLGLTRSGQLLGTPAFAAPEQLRGGASRLDPRADIFSLGATLHCALSGREPFRGGTPDRLVESIFARKRPSLARIGLPRDLETIVGKCLEAESRHRYATADEVADELERLIDLRPIRARPLGVAGRAVRYVQRKQSFVLVGGLAALLALLVAGLVVVWLVRSWSLDQRVADALELARFHLLEPTHSERVILSDRGEHAQRPSAFSAAPTRALAAYDDVLRLAPEDLAVRAEREVVAAAAALMSGRSPAPEGGLQALAPGTWAAALAWYENPAASPEIPQEKGDRRWFGLLSFLTDRVEECHRAWGQAELDDDPFIDAAAAQMHMVRGRHDLAFARAAVAAKAWPEAGFLAVDLADCAVRLGDLDVARRELARAETLELRDPFHSHVRVRADWFAAMGRDTEAIADYEWLLERHRGVTARRHFAALRERRGEWREACELWLWLAEQEPDGGHYFDRAIRAWGRIWQGRSVSERADAVCQIWEPSVWGIDARVGGLWRNKRTVYETHASSVGDPVLGSERTKEVLMWIEAVSHDVRWLPERLRRLIAVAPSVAFVPEAAGKLDALAKIAGHVARLSSTIGVWLAGSLTAQVNWVDLTAGLSGSTPVARVHSAMAYDAARQVMTMFGGYGTSALGDTWEFSNSQWVQVAANPQPPASWGGAMVFDRVRSECLLFGGFTGSGYIPLGPWARTTTGWTNRTVANGPPSRYHAKVAHDEATGVTYLLGGYSGTGATAVVLSDFWRWDGSSWMQLSGGPSARYNHAMTWDSVRSRLVVFGGVADANAQTTSNVLADTWEWSGSWTNPTTPSAPSARGGAGMSFDADRAVSVLHGGNLGSLQRTDTWEWNGANWTQRITPTVYPVSSVGAFAYDTHARRIVSFGGAVAAGTWRNQTWAYVPQVPWSLQVTGTGCPSQVSPFAVPSLDRRAGTGAWIGDALTLEVAHLPQASLSVLAVDFTNPMTSLAPHAQPGCLLHAGLGFASLLLGSNAYSLSIPNDPVWLGLPPIHAQVLTLLLNPGPGQTVIDAVSNGVAFTVGTR